jgi:SpoVK/Ycf46/Vps4 family AAA+-type ATPase
MNKKINEEFKKLIEEQIQTVNDPVISNVEIEHRIEHYPDIGWFACNKLFKIIPSEYHSDKLYTMELLEYLTNNSKIIHRKIVEDGVEGLEHGQIICTFLYKNMVVVINYLNIKEEPQYIRGIHFFHSSKDIINLDEFTAYELDKKPVSKIGIIKQTKFGPHVTWRDHETQNKFSEDHYNDDFPAFFDDLCNKLVENPTGLYLFYGEAGTGKSSAIRHLITKMERKFVFIPPQMINYLSNPEFTELVLSSLKDSVLIIEDAEKALMKRETEDGFYNSELVSTLLNLTDGLYADLARTSIIATYNCDRNLIDPALLRKGRLRSEYKFTKLNAKKSQILMDKLGNDVKVDDAMTLADIFNYEKQYTNEERKKPKRVVGFGG